MKNSRLAAALAITLLPSLASTAYPQGGPLFPGNLVLASQGAVDAASAYGGVTGNLTISGADIVDLGPLAGFTQVGGYVSVQGNPSLTQVIGVFPSLTDVGGGMFFYDNDSLFELSGFDALLQTGDNIDFWFNDVLETVSGFASLHTAGWSLEFGGNPNLSEIPRFSSLQTISSSLFILGNDSLEAIDGFQALQSVSWSFQIQDNTSLNDLCGLHDYFTLNNPYTGGGAFDIRNNGPGLPNPTTEQDVINAGPCMIGTNYCAANPNSTGVSGAIRAIGSLRVVDNDVVLVAERLPLNAFGFLLTSATQGLAANPGGSQGNLCLGGSIGRYVGPGQIQNSGVAGAFDLALDLTQQPSPTGFVVVQPGETWNFQSWFRDANPGPTSNFTDAVSITFE